MNAPDHPAPTLRGSLDHEPRPLQFGTSGRRGLLADLTQLEIFINALAELEYLQTLPPDEGGIVPGDVFFFAADLRPSSTRFMPGPPQRGELAQAIEAAIRQAGMVPVYCGTLPTPALTVYALSQGKGSIMITGSHIPFDRNGYKTNTSRGELLKQHEPLINARVQEVRERLYDSPVAGSPFGPDGQFSSGHRELPPVNGAAEQHYINRYLGFFGGQTLQGLRVLVYQHSAVGRDLLPRILRELGAEVSEAGRSETFVPIDTENIGVEQLAAMQSLVDAALAEGPLDALVSTDGDSDRPLILAIDPATGEARFFGGDLVGMLTADYLGPDAVVVPISCNDAIDRGTLGQLTEPKTRIGSPYVIAGMEAAAARGKQAVCGWEANGGFLTGSNLTRHGRVLPPLPTRDALLPIIAVLASCREAGKTLIQAFSELPERHSTAALLKNFPRERGLAIIRRYSPGRQDIGTIRFADRVVTAFTPVGTPVDDIQDDADSLWQLREELSRFFTPAVGFGPITGINVLDGIRIYFGNGDVAHLRPSGNADEFRIYAVADTRERARDIAALGVAEPDGILRTIEAQIG